jgi:hypothetical protein
MKKEQKLAIIDEAISILKRAWSVATMLYICV